MTLENREYISTGILELFAAGSLPEIEASNVEDMIRKYSDVREEYESIIRLMHLITLQNLETPSLTVKENIFNEINEIKSNKSGKHESIRASEGVAIRGWNSYRFLMAACIALLMFSLAGNYFLWRRLKFTETEKEILADQRKLMVQELEVVNTKLGTASNDMKIMTDRNYKMIEMNGLEKSPDSKAVAFWNPSTGKVYVGVSSLPVPPKDKQYQLWGISDGKPVDAGVMDVDPSDKSLHEMKNLRNAQAFAITLETKGGSSGPTMDQMYVMGKL